jgi:restriction system protein
MVCLPAEKFEKGIRKLFVQLTVCPYCGWWNVYRVLQGEHPRTPDIECYDGAIGSLRELDLTDISVPLAELRSYLVRRSDALFEVHPRRFEEVVCSVFCDLGYNARATAYSRDGGVDIVLEGSAGTTVGVQVKRYAKERQIEAEQIRSLAGALLVNGHTRGVFVTTSSFRKGAKATAKQLTAIGYPVELMDAERFLDALGIAQFNSFELDQERYAAYVLSQGVDLGSGRAREFVAGENLVDRPVVAWSMLTSDLIDLHAMGGT